jgi:hypothetical protein
VTDSSHLSTVMPTTPLCISCKDLQVFKGKANSNNQVKNIQINVKLM